MAGWKWYAVFLVVTVLVVFLQRHDLDGVAPAVVGGLVIPARKSSRCEPGQRVAVCSIDG